MNKRSDVVIIGAGIIGLACAEQFARMGNTVTILDRHLPGAGQTTRTGGGIRLAHGSELNIRLTLRSLPVWMRFSELYGVDPAFRQTGHLFLTSEPETIERFQSQVALQAQMGVESDLLERKQVVDRWAQLENISATHALSCRQGGYLDHHRVVDGYVRKILSMGVHMELGCRAENIIQEAGRVVGVETSSRDFRSQIVINAAGPLAGHFTAQVGGRDPYVSRRHELLIVAPATPVSDTIPWIIDVDRQVHLRPDGGGRALMGGFLGKDEPSDPRRFDRDYTDSWADRVRQVASTSFDVTERDCPIVTGWAGLYPGTTDYFPVAEITCPGMITVAGLSGTGLMHAPALAEIAWDLANASNTSWIDTTTLSSKRFETALTQLEGTGF